MGEKLFIGPRLRLLRQAKGWKLEACAAQLGLSASYLSQIEANQRPVTARVLIDVMRVFEVDAASLDAADDQRLIADLREATADAPVGGEAPALSEIKAAVANTPNLAKAYLDLHRAYRRLDERLKATEEAVSLDERGAASALLPYEEVRDFFHYKNNYIHSLDVAAEDLSAQIGGGGERALEAYLADRLGVRVVRSGEPDLLRHWDAASRTVAIGAAHPEATRSFQLAYQIAALTLPDIVEAELSAAGFRSDSAAKVCRTGLLNYAAGALVLPYERFREAARAARHDIERLALTFQTSLEQVFHRLSTLQRPGARGVPFYFVRLDRAGNITKRHSATRLQFARFGGACPLWNVHDAFARPDAWLVQLAQMPDAVRYVCIARGVVKPSGAYRQAERRYALGLGCEARYADQLVYADELDLAGPSAPIGVSCRICERDDCSQRAFPPVDRAFEVFENDRRWVPFSLRG
ncbi:Cro/Cl family transcriptional regulator [Caulobacter flavus]|uniref:Cro/Cl family transcriptional regulator n=1 Tax=Caulobacter flavus TaxID=1679497 RepID=A0A2N5CKR3_9CAUL|nr:short-chain fatty acyl-CoA regulator family protein [Caulobacter flavus]AYV47193.1 Cro/Cl family transcriptional regulator [Caulobacter flavus]PLR06156.1 Cro/Cl family transcriptional regulator [Caulobacter flavus]